MATDFSAIAGSAAAIKASAQSVETYASALFSGTIWPPTFLDQLNGQIAILQAQATFLDSLPEFHPDPPPETP